VREWKTGHGIVDRRIHDSGDENFEIAIHHGFGGVAGHDETAVGALAEKMEMTQKQMTAQVANVNLLQSPARVTQGPLRFSLRNTRGS
jgi:hypothetical protein